jgi:hypothetical protein
LVECFPNSIEYFQLNRLGSVAFTIGGIAFKFHQFVMLFPSLYVYVSSIIPCRVIDWHVDIAAPAVLSTATRVLPIQLVISMAPAPTFSQTLTASHKASSNENLLQPSIRGESVSIRISQAPYEKGIEICKRNLQGRLVLSKGDKPYTSKDLQLKLQKIWKTTGPWCLLSLGKGYYELFFASEADMCSAWTMGTIHLKSGVLRLFE